MAEKFKNFIQNIFNTPAKDRKALEEKVEAGTDRAIKEYKEVFEKLAEYDKS